MKFSTLLVVFVIAYAEGKGSDKGKSGDDQDDLVVPIVTDPVDDDDLVQMMTPARPFLSHFLSRFKDAIDILRTGDANFLAQSSTS